MGFAKWRRKRAEKKFFKDASRQEIFSWIFSTNKWGSGESISGKGSEIKQTEAIRQKLPDVLTELEVQTLLDLPCGDLNWLDPTQLAIRYIGADIVEPIVEANRLRFPGIEFLVLDACEDPLPDADFLLMRDMLVHLCFTDALRVIDNIQKSDVMYVGCTTYPNVARNEDKITGKHHRLNMLLPPFNWPEPIHYIDEQESHGKGLGVWRMEDLN